MILGAPRSGTTWLGKIFDSHPRVLYRHEPDSVYRTVAIPSFNAPLRATSAKSGIRLPAGTRESTYREGCWRNPDFP
jgi:hypothetical protein